MECSPQRLNLAGDNGRGVNWAVLLPVSGLHAITLYLLRFPLFFDASLSGRGSTQPGTVMASAWASFCHAALLGPLLEHKIECLN